MNWYYFGLKWLICELDINANTDLNNLEEATESLTGLELDNSDVECLCSEWLINLSLLSYLSLDLESNLISNNGAIELGNSLVNLSLLSYLYLNLKDNYIDNTTFE